MKRAPKKPNPMTVSELARLGGKARAKSLTRKDRSESARKAALARWRTARAKPASLPARGSGKRAKK